MNKNWRKTRELIFPGIKQQSLEWGKGGERLVRILKKNLNHIKILMLV